MPGLEPHMDESVGHDALQVWMDFWELTGRNRGDIIRKTESGGDPERMIPPDVSTTTIAQVPLIIVGRERDIVRDRAGEFPVEEIRLEFIDCVRETDKIRLGGIEHEVDMVQERMMGNFSIWLVLAHRVD